MSWNLCVYHHDDGSIQIMSGDYFFYRSDPAKEEQKAPYTFQDSLSYKNYKREQSGITFYMTSQKGDIYPMFISEFDAMLKKSTFPVFQIIGWWGFKKQGTRISLVYLGENNEAKNF